LKPGYQISDKDLAEKLGISENEIVQVDFDFWAINPEVKINKCPLY